MREYADEEEQRAMEICSTRCVVILRALLSSIEYRSRVRAIDVAGGDGPAVAWILEASGGAHV